MYIPKCSVCNVYLIITLKASARPCNTIIKSATALKLEKVIRMGDCKANFLLSPQELKHKLQIGKKLSAKT